MENVENNSKLMRKRPEMARYKPGMGKILAKKLDISDNNNDSNRSQPKTGSSDGKLEANQRRINHEKSADTARYSEDRNDAKSAANNQNSTNNKVLNKKPDILVYDSRKHGNSNRVNNLSKYESNNSNANNNRDKDRDKTPVSEKQRNNNNNYKQDFKEQRQPKAVYRDKLYGNKTHQNKSTKENNNSTKFSETESDLKRKEINDTIKSVEHYVSTKKDFKDDIDNTGRTNNQSLPKSFPINEINKLDNNYKEHQLSGDNKFLASYDNARGNKINARQKNNTINSNENKLWNSSGKTETVRHRSFSSNKSQHRYEQQIPPRFLKQQQLLKKMENEKVSQTSDAPNDCHQQSERNAEHHQQQQHRGGLIRLPPSTLNTQQDMNSRVIPNDENSLNSTSHSKAYGSKSATNTSKPCVAIRPTPHVSSNKFQPYSPSSSPETTALYSYQQMNSYMHTNFSDHSPITPSMLSSSVGENESRLQNTPDSALSRKKWKPNVDKSYTEAVAAENDLHLCLIQSPIDHQKVEQLRYRIQLRYEHIILSDLRVCAEYNIEQRLWKAAFYQFIEHYRRLVEQMVNQQEMKTAFNKIVDEATLFFENLLVKMQETYNFCIEKLLSHEYDRETANYDILKLAAISAQKINLYMGDLSRYKEVEIRNSNFSKSKFFYNRAQMLAPKNGRSYNQLALLAMYQNRRLDAVYYYMRSLAASNPFLTARENLLAIFDEVRRKYELAEKKRKQELTNNSKCNKEDEFPTSDNERIEIWIRPDGTSNMCSSYANFFAEESGKDELEMLSSVDLNKRFVLSFLHVHGKLFSKVGMDASEFIPVVNQMLLEFHCLLRRSPIPVSSQRLLQLLAINMFAVFHTSLKDASYGNNCRSLLQEQAIQVTLAMISSLLECANGLLTKHLHINTQPNFNNDDLSEILPTIKIWTDWMSCQKHLWCPPPPPTEFNLSCDGDIWTVFAEFLTLLTRINVREVKLLPSKLEGCEPVILPEDTQLSGFLPLLGSPQCVQFAQPPYDKEKAKTCLRITVIQFFGDYLCGIADPYLKFDVERKRFVSLIPTLMSSNVDETNEFNCNLSDETSENENDDLSIDGSSIDTASNYNNDTISVKSLEQTEIEILWSRKEALRKAKQRQEIIKQRVDAVLNEENQRNPSRIIIQPRYIIPDTNCFIDHLPMLRALISSKFFDLIVPLIVINELNGLKSRGIKTNKPLTFTDDHEGHVGNAAMDTIEYLMKAFSDKHLRLRAITSKGNLLDNINFTSESFSDTKGNSNDDFILNACLRFIKDKPLDKTITHSESKSIFREVVLLTEDRNLRIKALSHNVPVKSLPLFLKWANIPMKH